MRQLPFRVELPRGVVDYELICAVEGEALLRLRLLSQPLLLSSAAPRHSCCSSAATAPRHSCRSSLLLSTPAGEEELDGWTRGIEVGMELAPFSGSLFKKKGRRHTHGLVSMLGGWDTRWFEVLQPNGEEEATITYYVDEQARAESTRREHTQGAHTERAHGGSTRREHTQGAHTERAHGASTHRGNTHGGEGAHGREGGRHWPRVSHSYSRPHRLVVGEWSHATLLHYYAALRYYYATILYYTHILHYYTTLLYSTIMLHYSATLIYYTTILHYYTTLLCYTTILHYYTTILHNYATRICILLYYYA